MRPATPIKLTYADYLALPDDGRRHELIDGVHFVTPSPQVRHQRVVRRLAFSIEAWVQEHPIGELFFAPFDVVLSDVDVVVPDVLFVSSDRAQRVEVRGVFGAPDLVAEVLSPGTRHRDEGVKRALYERAGVREYWVVDADVERVLVHRLERERFGLPVALTRQAGDVLKTALLPGWELPLATLFE